MAETVKTAEELAAEHAAYLEDLKTKAEEELVAHQAQVEADHTAALAASAEKFPEYFPAEEDTK